MIERGDSRDRRASVEYLEGTLHHTRESVRLREPFVTGEPGDLDTMMQQTDLRRIEAMEAELSWRRTPRWRRAWRAAREAWHGN